MGPLLGSAVEHWSAYITTCGFKDSYAFFYEPLMEEIRQKIELPSRPDV